MSDIDKKLDDIAKDISGINVTLAKQSVLLDDHVKRSKQLEDRVEPLEKQHHEIVGSVKFLKIIGVVASILEAIHLIFS